MFPPAWDPNSILTDGQWLIFVSLIHKYQTTPGEKNKNKKSIMTFKSEHKVPMDLCPEVIPVDAQKCFGLRTDSCPSSDITQ